MASSLNKVQLIGNLGRDPEVRTFQNGGKVVNLRIATSETWKDRTTGERRERTEWHSVAIFNEGIATVAERYLKKGSKVYIEGKLETRKWQDQNGQDRYSTEVVIRPYGGELKMLDSRRNSDDDAMPYDSGNAAPSSNAPAPRNNNGNNRGGAPYQGGGYTQGGAYGNQSRDLDDDIPF